MKHAETEKKRSRSLPENIAIRLPTSLSKSVEPASQLQLGETQALLTNQYTWPFYASLQFRPRHPSRVPMLLHTNRWMYKPQLHPSWLAFLPSYYYYYCNGLSRYIANYQLAHYSGFCRISPSILNRFTSNLQAVCHKTRLREFLELFSSSGFRARRRRDFFNGDIWNFVTAVCALSNRSQRSVYN